ncbi:hypothetical protein H4R35_004124 [Dimargaris xerosporica]|nr:hypothetical protein H4R35_004124 [Dimargaris xerosporica]
MGAPTSEVVVSQLYIYPVKSCAGIAVSQALVTKYGFLHDRFWVITDNEYKFITQREESRLVLIQPRIVDTDEAAALGEQRPFLGLAIKNDPTVPELRVTLYPTDQALQNLEQCSVKVWATYGNGYDLGDDVAAWLSAFLGRPVRLVRRATTNMRPMCVNTPLATMVEEPAQSAYADDAPMSIVSEASLADVNTKRTLPVDIRHFRPNIVVAGCSSFAEETWAEVLVQPGLNRAAAPTRILVTSRCTRCQMVNNNPDTGIPLTDQPPLKTLMSYRRVDPGAKYQGCFSMNCVPVTLGQTMAVGDTVQIVATGKHHRKKHRTLVMSVDLTAFSASPFDLQEWLNATLASTAKDSSNTQPLSSGQFTALQSQLQFLIQEVQFKHDQTTQRLTHAMPAIAKDLATLDHQTAQIREALVQYRQDILSPSLSLPTPTLVNTTEPPQALSRLVRLLERWSALDKQRTMTQEWQQWDTLRDQVCIWVQGGQLDLAAQRLHAARVGLDEDDADLSEHIGKGPRTDEYLARPQDATADLTALPPDLSDAQRVYVERFRQVADRRKLVAELVTMTIEATRTRLQQELARRAQDITSLLHHHVPIPSQLVAQVTFAHSIELTAAQPTESTADPQRFTDLGRVFTRLDRWEEFVDTYCQAMASPFITKWQAFAQVLTADMTFLTTPVALDAVHTLFDQYFGCLADFVRTELPWCDRAFTSATSGNMVERALALIARPIQQYIQHLAHALLKATETVPVQYDEVEILMSHAAYGYSVVSGLVGGLEALLQQCYQTTMASNTDTTIALTNAKSSDQLVHLATSSESSSPSNATSRPSSAQSVTRPLSLLALVPPDRSSSVRPYYRTSTGWDALLLQPFEPIQERIVALEQACVDHLIEKLVASCAKTANTVTKACQAATEQDPFNKRAMKQILAFVEDLGHASEQLVASIQPRGDRILQLTHGLAAHYYLRMLGDRFANRWGHHIIGWVRQLARACRLPSIAQFVAASPVFTNLASAKALEKAMAALTLAQTDTEYQANTMPSTVSLWSHTASDQQIQLGLAVLRLYCTVLNSWAQLEGSCFQQYTSYIPELRTITAVQPSSENGETPSTPCQLSSPQYYLAHSARNDPSLLTFIHQISTAYEQFPKATSLLVAPFYSTELPGFQALHWCCSSVLWGAFFAPLVGPLRTYASLAEWQGEQSHTHAVSSMNVTIPTFSLSPSPNTTQMGEYLLSLPQLWDTYLSDSHVVQLLATIPDPFYTSLLACDEGDVPLPEPTSHPLNDTTDPSPPHIRQHWLWCATNDLESMDLGDLKEDVLTQRVTSLTQGLLVLLVQQILVHLRGPLSALGQAQLVTDLKYVANIVQAMGVDAIASFTCITQAAEAAHQASSPKKDTPTPSQQDHAVDSEIRARLETIELEMSPQGPDALQLLLPFARLSSATITQAVQALFKPLSADGV